MRVGERERRARAKKIESRRVGGGSKRGKREGKGRRSSDENGATGAV
jgi:hypothetical protein